MPNIGKEQLERIESATADLTIAHREVERVLSELTADTPRAQKTIITDALRLAFEKLANARANLLIVTNTLPRTP